MIETKTKMTAIRSSQSNKNVMCWHWEEENEMRLVEIQYLEKCSDGYIYNVVLYCPTKNIKITYQHVKSEKDLLSDNETVEKYMINNGKLCEKMADSDVKREAMDWQEHYIIDMCILSSLMKERGL